MINEIGIAVLDIYNDDALLECTKSLSRINPDLGVSSYIISNRTKPTKDFVYDRVVSSQVGMSTLRNLCLAHFRCLGLKYIFLINSNVIVKDPNFIEKTVKTAQVFGSWLLTGYEPNPTILDDTETNTCLCINTKLNTDIMFIRSGLVGTMGYLDERFLNTKFLDVLDYIEKARKPEFSFFPPFPFCATTGDCFEYKEAPIERIGHCDILDEKNKQVAFSYGYFQHLYKYIPGFEETRKPANKEELMNFMGKLQEDLSTK